MWTYANAAPLSNDLPQPNEAALKIPWQHGNGVGIETEHLIGDFTVGVPGFHIVYAMLSFIGTTGVTYFFELRGTGGTGGFFRATADGLTGGTVNVALMGGAFFHEDDIASLYVWCDTDSTSITIVDGQFGIISL